MFSLPPDVSVDGLLEHEHEAVQALKPRWAIGLDAYDGEGGFTDGGYLWKFPRENPGEFTARQQQARYHNYAATLIDYYVRKVCAEITRETSSEPLKAFWANVDGAGTDQTTYIRLALSKALAAGHVGILADKTTDAPTGPSKADEQAAVFLTRYLATAILDWRVARDEQLTAVKLVEDIPVESLLDAGPDEGEDQRVLLWDEEEWVRVSPGDPAKVERQTHGLALVPLVILRPFRHARWPVVGRALLEPSVLAALYNRASEQDEVIRNQSFSVFVVGLPANGEINVEDAKKALGNEVGSLRALFTYGTGTYETPSVEVPKTLEAHQQFLIRELYRMAHIPFEADSKEVQSAEAIRLQHEAITGVLKGVAAECQRVELALAKLFFAWTSATPDAARAAFEAADVQIKYGDRYFEADPEVELKTLVAASNAVQSETFDKYVQKQIVSNTAPHLDDETREKVDGEIDAATPEPVADVMALRTGAEARLLQARAQAQGDGDPGEELAA